MMARKASPTNSTSPESNEARSPIRSLPLGRFKRLLSLVFSFPAFLGSGLVVLAALTVKGRFDDPDIWWQLRIGQVIWATHSAPTTEIFSHTAAGYPWIPHEWLSQLSIYAAYYLGGYVGLMAWLTIFASLLLVLLYALSSLYSGDSKLAFLGGLIGWYFGTVGMAIRPLVIGHTFVVIELLLLHLGRTRDRRWFWLLPLVFGIWVNCHGSYASGLVILVVTGACGFFDLKIGPVVSFAWAARTHRTYIWASLLSFVALLWNPEGWRLLRYPIDVLFLQHTGLANVNEWLPLPLLDIRAAGLLAILIGVAVAAAAGRVEVRLDEAILLAMVALLAVRHQRMLFLFGVVSAPIVCRLAAAMWSTRERKRDLPIANAVCMGIAVLTVALSFPTQSDLEDQVRKSSPVAAVEFIRNAHLQGPMLNDYTLGGYLMWTLPEHKVFVDGRADVYDWTGVLEEFGRWALLKEDPQLLLNKYKIQFCVLDSGAPMSHVLPYLPGWRKAYGDAQASVFVRD
jgi:hypothetical protein